MKVGSSGGASLCEGFHEEDQGTLREGSLLGNPKDDIFERDAKCPVNGPLSLSLHRGPVGEPGGGTFTGTFERKEKYIWVPFLDPGAIKILSLGAI
jgi:hypothetical protein